ncbi:hypothetical protein GCM10027570_48970 [Streptomonospora sediminis]
MVALEHGRSMEAEACGILAKGTRRPHIGIALLCAAQAAGGVEDLPVPERASLAALALRAMAPRNRA